MIKQFVVLAPARVVNLSWLSLQPDGAVSFGLSDRNFRVRDDAGEVRANPHFTFHPAAYFHVKAPKSKNEIFAGIADLALMLSDQQEVPWLRAVTAPISKLPSRTSSRKDGVERETIGLRISSEDHSIAFELDFIAAASGADDSKELIFESGCGALRVKAYHVSPQSPSLYWFHFG